jgi:hypothetical protein
MAARQMGMSQRYRCPPGTGMLKELMTMFMAMNTAAMAIRRVALSVFSRFIGLPPLRKYAVGYYGFPVLSIPI